MRWLESDFHEEHVGVGQVVVAGDLVEAELAEERERGGGIGGGVERRAR
jgi:hypothetical protein